MPFAKTPPSGPYSAVGTITAIAPITKPKKTGGTYTVNIVTLDSGVEVDFGFKAPPFAVGDSVFLEVMKEYGAYKFKNQHTADPGFPKAFPARGAGSVGGIKDASGVSDSVRHGRGTFPIPREDYQTSIIRQNALTNAVKLMGDTAAQVGYVDGDLDRLSNEAIRIAYKFASFSAGHYDDIVKAEAEKTAANVVPITAKTKAK